MENIWTGITDVPAHFLEDTNMIVRVKKNILFAAIGATGGNFMGFQACLSEHNNEPLGALIVRSNWHCLLSRQRRQRRERLSPRTLLNWRAGSGHLLVIVVWQGFAGGTDEMWGSV